MTFVIVVIAVTLAIASMMIVRLVVFGRAQESRQKSGLGNVGCDDHECLQGCGGSRGKAAAERDQNRNTRRRSNSHAS